MIYSSGNLAPTKTELQESIKRGDESFSTRPLFAFGLDLPEWEGRKIDFNSFMLLKCKNVEPHIDCYVADGEGGQKRIAIFWLTKGNLHLQCGNESKRMKSGDYVIFDDSKMHCVVADKQWYGAAAQYL